jgi:hypothetical protein
VKVRGGDTRGGSSINNQQNFLPLVDSSKWG